MHRRDAEDAKVISLRLGGFEPSHPKVGTPADIHCRIIFLLRGMAQPGSALRSGRRGPGFKSLFPDSQVEMLFAHHLDACFIA